MRQCTRRQLARSWKGRRRAVPSPRLRAHANEIFAFSRSSVITIRRAPHIAVQFTRVARTVLNGAPARISARVAPLERKRRNAPGRTARSNSDNSASRFLPTSPRGIGRFAERCRSTHQRPGTRDVRRYLLGPTAVYRLSFRPSSAGPAARQKRFSGLDLVARFIDRLSAELPQRQRLARRRPS